MRNKFFTKTVVPCWHYVLSHYDYKRKSKKQKTLLFIFSLFLFLVSRFQPLAQTFSAIYTVTSTTAVNPSGTRPVGSTQSYSQTYNTAKQLTSGNKAILTLNGYAGYRITGFRFQMRSNTSSGAGNMNVTVGSTSIFSIPTSAFNTANWNNAYSANYVNLNRIPSTLYTIGAGESVVIEINATTNSLYIQEFEVLYELAAAPCSVAVNPSNATINSCVSVLSDLSWTHSTCYDEYLVVAKPGTITSTPSGNGSAYTANATYGSGTAFDGGFIVYKGNLNSASITGLTAGTNYEFKIFARRGTDWSSGITAYCTPSSGPCLDEALQSTSAPSGWLDTNITYGVNYAEFTSYNGSITTTAVAFPSTLTFDLARSSNSTAKTLNVRVSTTSATSGFTTLATYTHSNTVSGGSVLCTVDLSAYSAFPTVYIQFEKVSSTTSPWRLYNVKVMCNSSAPSCNLPSYLEFSESSFAPVEQNVIPSFDIALACSSGINSACNDGNITLTTTGCGLSGTLIKPVNSGIAIFDDIKFLRSAQANIVFEATYSGSCGSNLTGTSVSFTVNNPPATPTINVLKDMDFSTNTMPWNYTIGTPITVGTGGSNGTDVVGVVTLAGNSFLRKSYSVNNSSGERGSTNTITFDNVSINPAHQHELYLKVASLDDNGLTSNSNGGGADINEDLILEISLDGGNTWMHTFTQVGGANKMFKFNASPQVTIAHNAGISYTGNTSDFKILIPVGISNLSFRVTATNNRIQEIWGIDDILLHEIVPPLGSYNPLPTINVASPIIVCPGTSAIPSITVSNNVGATTYQWNANADISNLTVSNPTITPSANNQVYTLVVTDAQNCKDSNSVTFIYPAGNVGEWKGYIDEDWFDCRNWGAGLVPDSSTHVVITAGAHNPCVISDTSSFVSGVANAYANSIQVDYPNLYLKSHALNNVHLYVKTDVNIGANGSIIAPLLDGSNITLKGNWTNNNASVNSSNYLGEVRFVSNYVQSILGVSGTEEFYSLYLQNPTFISLLSDVNASKMYMDANIKTNSKLFTLGNSNVYTSNLNYVSGYIDGKMRRYVDMASYALHDNYFPLGNTSFETRTVQLQFSSGGATGYIDAEYISSAMGGNGIPISMANSGGFGSDINMSESDGYWEIVPDASVSLFQTTPYTLYLSEEGYTNLSNPAAATIIKRDDIFSNWQALGNHLNGSNSNSVYTLGRSGLLGFSHFGFGYPDNPLPVTLASFNVNCNKGEVELNWTTSQESNSEYFVVQASKDAVNYVDLEKVIAAGNSNTLLNYKSSYINRDAYTYWRLKQVDYNLDFEIFAPKFLNCPYEEPKCSVIQMNGSLQLISPDSEQFTWEIFNTNGKIVYVSKVSGKTYVDVWNQLAAGIYYIKANGVNRAEVFKIVKL